MGWWGYGVLEGDPPSDVIDGLKAELNGDYDWDNDSNEKYTKWEQEAYDKLRTEEGMQKALAFIEGHEESDVAWQVLGLVCIQNGISIDAFKDRLIEAVDEDEWAKTNDERKEAMHRFRTQIDAFDGKTPIDISDSQAKGLLETVFNHMATGKQGLVNK